MKVISLSYQRNFTMYCCALLLLGAASWAYAGWKPEICDPYTEVDTSDDEYRISNNVGDYPSINQCIAPKNVGGEILAGFQLTQSHEQTDYPTFPSIVCGRHPWSDKSTGCLEEPVPLSSIAALKSRFLINGTEEAEGVCNAVYDLWLLPDIDKNHIGPPIGGIEVMIWPWRSPEMPPGTGGSQIDIVQLREKLDGIWQWVPYDVYYAASWGSGWQYVAFVRQEQSPRGLASINVKDALTYCQQAGWCQASSQLITIEAGFEIYKGCEGLTARAFSVSLRTR